MIAFGIFSDTIIAFSSYLLKSINQSTYGAIMKDGILLKHFIISEGAIERIIIKFGKLACPLLS